MPECRGARSLAYFIVEWDHQQSLTLRRSSTSLRLRLMSEKSTHPQSIGRLVAARPLRDVARALAQSNAATASGMWGSSLAAVTAAVEAELSRPILVVCGHIDEADDIADDMELFHGRRPEVVPALELGGQLG